MTKHRPSVSRRTFLGAGMAWSSLAACGSTPATSSASDRITVRMAGYEFDRVRPLIDGRVGIEGCEVEFERAAIGDMNTHVFSGSGTREVTEIGLSPYMLAYANQGFRDYTLIPVFPLRMFRHKSVFIRTDRGIERPEDLRGKRVATPGYSSTSLTWIRGFLQDEYGVTPKDVQWVVSAEDSSKVDAGQASKQEKVLPLGIDVDVGSPGKDESDLLVDGEVDALFHAVEPRAFAERDPRVARLFPDVRAVERESFAKTGIFPIMHAVAIRRETADAHPWLPEAVFRAYAEAKAVNDQALKREWIFSSLPWYGQELEATRELMGENFWPYGIEPNRKALQALFRYSFEQGLAAKELRVEEVFHPSTLELVESAE